MTEPNVPYRPTRRQVAKGAAWTVPVLTTAGLAPSLAASPQQCSVESEQAINNMVTQTTNQTYPLTLRITQLSATDGFGTTVWFNLRNDGSRTIRASSADPIVVTITFRNVNTSETRTRSINTYISSWGDVTRAVDTTARTTTFTWTITSSIPATGDREADVQLGILSGPVVYATATMDSFGPNDDLQSTDFTDLEEIITNAEQREACRTYYDAQISSNTGADAADYTLRASGSRPNTSTFHPWPVGSTMDSRTIGNTGGLAEYDRNGLW